MDEDTGSAGWRGCRPRQGGNQGSAQGNEIVRCEKRGPSLMTCE
ncbi:hypothetical protein LMG18101_04437 [Ralstonia flaminis]|jgi:hypothetical protein|uniref:Uncharacterized protein n=1 Tax=Ralstonia flaminis TaxID=3058597 RepID=A0ABN9JVD1_9RALS|nr:hypothetical protein LMG18101_04437 [Ralstonia sp. LMG 18101]